METWIIKKSFFRIILVHQPGLPSSHITQICWNDTLTGGTTFELFLRNFWAAHSLKTLQCFNLQMLTRPLFFGYLSIATGWSSHFGSKFPNAQLMPSNKQLRVRVSHESRYIGTSHGQSTEWQGEKHWNRTFQMPGAGVSRWHLAKESLTKVSPFSRFRVRCFLGGAVSPKTNMIGNWAQSIANSQFRYL